MAMSGPGTRPSSCERCGGRVRKKAETWWCYECGQPCEPIRARLPRLGRGPTERRDRVRARAYGSAERLAWIHQLPCVAQDRPGHVCGPWDMDLGRAPGQAVHVKARGAGGGADDVVPGCWVMHQAAGELGTSQRDRFEAETGLDLVQRAAELAADWRQHQEDCEVDRVAMLAHRIDVYPVFGGGGFVVSEYEVWVVGIYATETAARRAPGLNVDAVTELWDRHVEGNKGPLTDDDLDAIEAAMLPTQDGEVSPIPGVEPDGC